MALWDRLRRPRTSAGPEDDEATELRRRTADLGMSPIAEVADRTRAEVSGVARSLTHPPASSGPMSVVVELDDGTGVLDVVWLGRREVPGIRPGVHLSATGLVCTRDRKRTMFNPAYEILPPL